MKRILIAIFCGAFLCLGADAPKPAPAPKLTDTQKNQILELQLKLERAIRKANDAQKEFQDAQAALVSAAQSIQPEGYQITEDPKAGLVLVPVPKPEPKPQEKK